MKEEKVFRKAIKGLLKQGVQSTNLASTPNRIICEYRTVSGLKCAVGMLIKDDEYLKEMEYKSIWDLIESNLFPKRLAPHKDLLSQMQIIHDAYDKRSTPDAFNIFCARRYKELAKEYGFRTGFIDKLVKGS